MADDGMNRTPDHQTRRKALAIGASAIAIIGAVITILAMTPRPAGISHSLGIVPTMQSVTASPVANCRTRLADMQFARPGSKADALLVPAMPIGALACRYEGDRADKSLTVQRSLSHPGDLAAKLNLLPRAAGPATVQCGVAAPIPPTDIIVFRYPDEKTHAVYIAHSCVVSTENGIATPDTDLRNQLDGFLH